jgi:phosphoribosylformylglycinamidine synthase
LAGDFLRQANAAGLIGAAHDLSDGGLAVAAAEMALAGGVGVELVADDLLDAAGWFLGEDQGRYLLACRPEAVGDLMGRAREARVPLRDVGGVGGDDIRLGDWSVALDAIAAAHGQGLASLLD